MSLTPAQELAVTTILSAVHNGEKVVQLAGPPGVGKTFALKYILRKIPYHLTSICAPTHKAAKVLAKALDSNSVGTIHSLLGARQSYSATGGMKWSFDVSKVNSLFIVIDEASMVTAELYDQLMGIPNAQIITSGDPCQLPPVEESEDFGVVSPFYEHHPVTVSLTENIRNTRKPFNALLNVIRDCILNSSKVTARTVQFMLREHLDADHIDRYLLYGTKRYPDKKEVALDQLLRQYQDGDAVLAFRTGQKKNTVGELNTHLRRILYPSAIDEYQPGEKLMFETNYPKKKYYTCDVVRVQEVTTKEFRVEGSQGEISLLRGYELDISRSKTTLCRIAQEDIPVFKQIAAKRRVQIRDLVKNKSGKADDLWTAYYEWEYGLNAPVCYAYAISVHKSQGSSYDNIQLYLTDFLWMLYDENNLAKQMYFLRLLYTAISRSRGNVFIA